MRAGADARTPFFDCGAKAHPLKLAYTVRRDENAGADFAECGRLLVDLNLQTMRDQRIGGEQPADAATDDCNAWTHSLAHRFGRDVMVELPAS